MASDSQLDLEDGLDADSLRLEQIQLEAKAARLEAEANALQAKLDARKRAARKRSAPAHKSPPEPAGKPTAVDSTPAAKATAATSSKTKGQAVAKPAEQMPTEPKAPSTQGMSSPLGSKAKADRRTKSESVSPSDQSSDEQVPLDEQPTGSFFSRMLLATPSYLVSAIVHLVILIVLAMIMLPPPDEIVKQLVVDASALEEETELEEFTMESFESELEQVELEEPEMAKTLEVADPGAADLGAVAQDIQAQVSDFQVSMNDTDLDTIGALFGSEGQGMADTMEGAGGAEFFGVKASGRKFVFIVDSSKSMKNGKFQAACEELMYAVSRLSKDQYFYVLFFDHDAAKMTFPGNKKPEPRAVPATSENINKLGQWVRTVELELKTNPYDCIEFALTLYPDAIYILTDGKFTDRGRAVKYLKKENLFEDPVEGTTPKTVIHTVGFYQRDGETTLKPLADLHGGTYRFVPPPKKR